MTLSPNTPKKRYAVLAFDDVAIDLFYHVSDEELKKRGLVKDQNPDPPFKELAKVKQLVEGLIPNATEAGGSAANSLSQITSRGGSPTLFCGRFGRGEYANIFRTSLNGNGVSLQNLASNSETATGHVSTFITPDGTRTMVPFFIDPKHLSTDEVAAMPIDQAQIFMTSAYSWGKGTKEGLIAAFDKAHDTGGKVAFSLASSGVVSNHRKDILNLINDKKINIVFANESEIQALYPDLNISEIIGTLQSKRDQTFCITSGEAGSRIIHHGTVYETPAVRVPDDNIVDTLGAGDAYAGGVLYGITSGKPVQEWGKIGAEWGAATVQHRGGRKPIEPDTQINERNAEGKLTSTLHPLPGHEEAIKAKLAAFIPR